MSLLPSYNSVNDLPLYGDDDLPMADCCCGTNPCGCKFESVTLAFSGITVPSACLVGGAGTGGVCGMNIVGGSAAVNTSIEVPLPVFDGDGNPICENEIDVPDLTVVAYQFPCTTGCCSGTNTLTFNGRVHVTFAYNPLDGVLIVTVWLAVGGLFLFSGQRRVTCCEEFTISGGDPSTTGLCEGGTTTYGGGQCVVSLNSTVDNDPCACEDCCDEYTISYDIEPTPGVGSVIVQRGIGCRWGVTESVDPVVITWALRKVGDQWTVIRYEDAVLALQWFADDEDGCPPVGGWHQAGSPVDTSFTVTCDHCYITAPDTGQPGWTPDIVMTGREIDGYPLNPSGPYFCGVGDARWITAGDAVGEHEDAVATDYDFAVVILIGDDVDLTTMSIGGFAGADESADVIVNPGTPDEATFVNLIGDFNWAGLGPCDDSDHPFEIPNGSHWRHGFNEVIFRVHNGAGTTNNFVGLYVRWVNTLECP